MPKQLQPEMLYVSEEFGIAGHLCPCGCGNKIITPLGPTDWRLTVTKGVPTLYPSIGNWQLPCRSHYWITNGEIEWSYQWTEKQILAGRQQEEGRRKSYYNNLQNNQKKRSIITRTLDWLSCKAKQIINKIKNKHHGLHEK